MTPDKIIVTLAGLATVAFVAWFFWFPSRKGIRAAVASSGYQEALILVKGGYTPDVVVVEHGRPVRLVFHRQESAACSERVLFGDFNKSVALPEGQNVAVELLPEKPGEYTFNCEMGMLRGKLIVE